jgi:hypothetical protein
MTSAVLISIQAVSPELMLSTPAPFSKYWRDYVPATDVVVSPEGQG